MYGKSAEIIKMLQSIDIQQVLHTLNSYLQPLLEYGSPALFVLLALGILALPIPDESLMVAAGFFMAKGKLSISLTMLAAYAGAMCGITVSYGLGLTVGHFFITRYGRWLGLTKAKIDRVENWFSRIGTWTLFVGYFVPGVRHLTGYVAGTLELKYKKFAIFAYSGAIIWASTFLLLGFLIGHSTK